MPRRSRANPVPAMRAHAANAGVRVAVRKYSALHDGLPPERIDYVRIRMPRYLVHLGKETASEYVRRVDDNGDGVENPQHEPYRHPFEHDAGSEIYYDDRGQRWLLGGRNKVTERGITDMKHRSRHHLGFIPRVNPDLTTGQILTRGVGLALIAVGANKAMDTVVDPFLSTDRTRALTKTGVAAVIGYALRKSYPFVAAGFIAAGALELIQLGYREFGLDRYEAMARDRVSAWAARLHAPATPPPPPPPGGGTHGLAGSPAGLGAGAQRFSPSPDRIRQAMNAA